MAKRSNVKSEDYSTELEEEIATLEEEQVNSEDQPSEVWLTLMVDSIVKTKGPVTGRSYVFSGAGSRILVDYEDAILMIERKRKSCCGSAAQTVFFEIGD